VSYKRVMAEIIYRRGKEKADTEFGSLHIRGDDQAANIGRNGLVLEYEVERFSCTPVKDDAGQYSSFEKQLRFLFGIGRENGKGTQSVRGLCDRINGYNEKGLLAVVDYTSLNKVALELYCTERWKVVIGKVK